MEFPKTPLNKNRLFNQTRWRLAAWYAGVMGLILSLSGFGVYEAIAHAHRVAAKGELQSVAGTLHDILEPTLEQPEHLGTATEALLPNLCLANESCLNKPLPSQRHILGAIYQGKYYLRFLDSSGKLIAQAGLLPQGLPLTSADEVWQLLKDKQGKRYLQISLSLHTNNQLPWGYLQVGRSLQDFDEYLISVQWIMLLGLPVAMLIVGSAAWWLAGLAMQPIYASYQQIQQFTADAAHELRTPLAAIRATVESVLRIKHLPEAEARDTLQVIERQNHRLSQLVSDLLLLSRLDLQLVGQHHSCNLPDIISDIEEELAALAVQQKVKLTTDIQVAKSLSIIANEEHLYRLVFNVVANAIQYTSAGGEVSLIIDSNEQWILIKVQDTGIGIAPEEQEKIFDRFYRVKSDRSRSSGGSGLGLSIACAIATAHQGSIQVQSELGKGSTFTIRLSRGK
ncbi:MAG: two-component system sensor histidine kinase RppB [Coleofasciculaceae cyanobacterium]